jgi:hypothetical protein
METENYSAQYYFRFKKVWGGNSNILAVSDHTITLMNLVFVNCKKKLAIHISSVTIV